jgi:hypothetical protein
MSADGRSGGGFEEPESHPRWIGDALLDAAATAGSGDASHDQLVAFEVAVRVREEPAAQALPALTSLLEALRAASATSYGALVNVLSAVQYALMLDDDVLGLWAPPRGSLIRVLDRAISENEPLREQAEDLLEALVEQRLVGRWLGRGASRLATRLTSPQLRVEVESQADHLKVALVPDGDEYPFDAVAA